MRRALLLLAAALTACAGYRPRTPTEAAVDAAAHRAHEHYVEAINSNDLERLLAMLTDDVVFLSANEPPMVGKAAVRPWLEAYYAAYRTHWDKPVQEFVVQGEWAYERYSWTSTDTSRADGSVVRGTGWGLLLYHHDADGEWRVARDALGPDHPPGPAQPTSGVQAAFVALTVPDLEASIAWCRDKLGLTVLNRPTGADSLHANLAGPGFAIELIQLRVPPANALDDAGGSGVAKVGVVLERQPYEQALARLRATQASFVGRELNEPDGSRSFIVEDNNGIRWQFFTR